MGRTTPHKHNVQHAKVAAQVAGPPYSALQQCKIAGIPRCPIGLGTLWEVIVEAGTALLALLE